MDTPPLDTLSAVALLLLVLCVAAAAAFWRWEPLAVAALVAALTVLLDDGERALPVGERAP